MLIYGRGQNRLTAPPQHRQNYLLLPKYCYNYTPNQAFCLHLLPAKLNFSEQTAVRGHPAAMGLLWLHQLQVSASSPARGWRDMHEKHCKELKTLSPAEAGKQRTGRLGEVCTLPCLKRADSKASWTRLFTSAELQAMEGRGSTKAGHCWERAQPWQEALLFLIPFYFSQLHCIHTQTKKTRGAHRCVFPPPSFLLPFLRQHPASLNTQKKPCQPSFWLRLS